MQSPRSNPAHESKVQVRSPFDKVKFVRPVCLSSAPCVLSCFVCPGLSVVSVLSFPGLSCPACHACPPLFCLALSCLLCLSCPVLVLSCLACPVFSLSCLVRPTLSAFCPLLCLCSPVLSLWPLYRHKKKEEKLCAAPVAEIAWRARQNLKPRNDKFYGNLTQPRRKKKLVIKMGYWRN